MRWCRCRRAVCILVLGLANSSLPIGVPAAAGDEFVCVWAETPPIIDGLGDDPAWSLAAVIDRFRIPGPDQQVPRAATRARLLWDRQALYFQAELIDHDLFGDITEHDARIWLNDVFEIFLKPSRDATGYFEFQVSAAGTALDMFLPDQTSGGYDVWKDRHPFHLETRVVRRGTLDNRADQDEGWTVEGRIPWVDLLHTGGRPDVGERWQLALCRYDYTAGQPPELSSCAALAVSDFHRHRDYATLRFAGPPGPLAAVPAGRPTQIHWSAARDFGTPEPPPPYRAVRVVPELKLTWPIFVAVEPGSRRLIVIDQHTSYGQSRLARTADDPAAGTLETLATPVGVAYSIAFHPRFADNGWMYVGSNGRRENQPAMSRVERYEVSRTAPYAIDGPPVTILEWESDGHNGAAVTFGRDGMLYVTSGDGTSDSDDNVVGQDLSTLLAKVLRIDVDHPTSGQLYAVPDDNPFVGQAGVRPETWAYGLRNPWRITTDPVTGQIWVGNNGQDMWEQAYLVARGANYGWSVYEGSQPFYRQRQLGPTPHVPPTVEHSHREARSLTGGVVYHGSKWAALRGAYLYGDYSTGKIWAVKHNGQRIEWHREIADTTLQIAAIGLDPTGELLIVDHRGDGQGGLYTLEPTAASSQRADFPRRLSETGLFADVASHRPTEGLIPYSVRAPLWSDGAAKDRYIALPPGGQIGWTDQWAWQFPDMTVLVKSFSLPLASSDPHARRWIETRLLVKREGEWTGYSYRWNAEQTDAELVGADGLDQPFVIDTPRGPSTQSWHYPSRAECMTCHTRAAGFVLGLTALQMNRPHDYGRGTSANQLAVLESLGVFKTDWTSAGLRDLRRRLQQQNVSSEEIDRQVKALRSADGQRATSSTALLGAAPDELPRLVDPYDSANDVNARARSYLHANCAYCHVAAGGGNSQIDLSFEVTAQQMKVIDVQPLHHTFGLAEARVVAPGAPERSVLLHRVALRGPGQMPQLATSVVDQEAVELLRRWIAGL